MKRILKFKNCVKLFVMIAPVFALLSCASIVKGPTQDIYVNSQPSGAIIEVYDKYNNQIWNGITPDTINLKRGDGFFQSASYSIIIAKEDFQERRIQISGSINGWYIAGNFFIGYLLGWLIIDPLTGAMWNLSPDNINASLNDIYSAEQDSLTIVLKENIPDDVFNDLTLTKIY